MIEAGGPPAQVLLADRGYDSDAIRKDMQSRGGVAVISARKNGRARESVDTRQDKTAASFLGFFQIASIRMWLPDNVNTG